MNFKAVKICTSLFLVFICNMVNAQKDKNYKLNSPDKQLQVSIDAGSSLQWSVTLANHQVIAPSVIFIKLSTGEVWGRNVSIVSARNEEHAASFNAINYKKKTVEDRYNQLTLNCKGDFGIIFRAYNDGIAYRFFTKKKTDLTINWEEANFNFDKDYRTFIPYARDYRLPGDQYINSFEALYDESPLSQVQKDSLAFLPLLVQEDNGINAAVLEAGLEDYPGMTIRKSRENNYGLKGDFAKYPLKEANGGYNNINYVVTQRAEYIARIKGNSFLPWRAIVITKDDRSLANNDMVQRLAEPSRLQDISWIKPGKVSWDWWNDWNITHVDFRAGMNTPTFKYYIDFAAANHLEYIIIDEGWSNDADLMQINPDVDIQQIIDYGRQKNVGVILWVSWFALQRDIDAVMKKYSAIGAKGFKIDFLDRDDQKMTSSTYAIAAKAAEYKMVVDFHGVYKPDGLQRTYPNVLNFEGVKGMENVKWTPADDMPKYEVSIPFIRMLSGPMDYTPGAMRNTNRSSFRPIGSMPVSQGTRCHQMAMYVVFEAPLEMLADNPSVYKKEQETTDFISKIPTTFDETIALDGKVGKYVAIARRKNDTWYFGAMTNWDARDISLDLSFLGTGNYELEIFKDGINADRDGTDYKKEIIKVTQGDKLPIHLMQGGGTAAIIHKIN